MYEGEQVRSSLGGFDPDLDDFNNVRIGKANLFYYSHVPHGSLKLLVLVIFVFPLDVYSCFSAALSYSVSEETCYCTLAALLLSQIRILFTIVGTNVFYIY